MGAIVTPPWRPHRAHVDAVPGVAVHRPLPVDERSNASTMSSLMNSSVARRLVDVDSERVARQDCNAVSASGAIMRPAVAAAARDVDTKQTLRSGGSPPRRGPPSMRTLRRGRFPSSSPTAYTASNSIV
jgi:hypothetical protein